MRRRAGRLPLVMLVAASAALGPPGCWPPTPETEFAGGSPDDAGPADNPPDQGSNGEEPGHFTFAEDADPLMAALPFVPDELLVRYLPGAAPEDLTTAYTEAGATVFQELPQLEAAALRVQPERLFEAAAALSSHPLLEAVHKSYLYAAEATPNDERFKAQAYLESIGLTEAWETTTGSEDVVIAVLDSGVFPTHPDLVDKLVAGWNTFDDDGNVAVAAEHGTWVAGVAAATTDNGEGIAGVSWGSPIMPVRVTDADGRASSRSLAAGLVWAIDHGAKVVNVSFAPLASDRLVDRAARYVRNSGGLVFISAGNDGLASVAAGSVNAVFVGAVTENDERASFSSTGPFVDLAAPGTGIVTTGLDGGYQRVSGTSFASPITAGVAALIWSARPDLRPVTVERVMTETAVDLGAAGRDQAFGAGRIDAAGAMKSALEAAEPLDTAPPSVRILSPADGETVSGVVTVRAEAADGDLEAGADSLVDVVLWLDGVPFATDTAAPFKFAVNTVPLSPGVHTLTCQAHDEAGNPSAPWSVEIVVSDGSAEGSGPGLDAIEPGVVINFPVSGTLVRSSVGIQATLTDNRALLRAEWRVDGVPAEVTSLSGVRAEVTFIWHAEDAARGPHTIAVGATDAAGNRAEASIRLLKE